MVIIRDIDKMFWTWDKELFAESDDERRVFANYREKMYKSVEGLIQNEIKILFCNMPRYFYQGRKKDIPVDIVFARMVADPDNMYRDDKAKDERLAYHLSNFIRFMYGDNELNTVLEKLFPDDDEFDLSNAAGSIKAVD